MRQLSGRAYRFAATLGLIGALVATTIVAALARQNPSQAVASSTRYGEMESEGIDWSRPPFPDAEWVAGLSVAASRVAFKPVIANSLGKLASVYVHRLLPTRVKQMVGLVYDHPSYGRFFLVEGPTDGNTARLAAWADQCKPENGCEGTWRMIDLTPNLRGLMVAGPVSTGVVWIVGGVAYDLYGPTESFTTYAATVLASAVASA
jgi:hypothetical protein